MTRPGSDAPAASVTRAAAKLASRVPGRVFWVALVLHVAVVLFVGPAMMASDDLSYMRAAHRLARGTFVLAEETTHWSQRLGFVAPVAAVFRAFGTGAAQAIAVTTAATVAGAFLLHGEVRALAGRRVADWCCALWLLMVFGLSSSTTLMPDHVVGVALFAAAAAVRRGRSPSCGRPALWGAFAALAIAYAVTTKLTAWWAFPACGLLFAADVLRRQGGRFWGAFAVLGALCGGAYLWMYVAQTGDALFRLRVIESGHNQTDWALAGAGAGELRRRLVVEPLLATARNLTVVALLAFCLPTLVRALVRRTDVSRGTFVYALFAASILAMCFWSSTSLERWAPMPLLPRMVATPVLFVLVLVAVRRGPANRLSRVADVLAVLLLIVSAVVVLQDGRRLDALARLPLVAAALVPLALPFVAARLPGSIRAVTGRPLRLAALALVLVGTGAYAVARGGIGETPGNRAERALPAVLRDEASQGAVRVLSFGRARAALELRFAWSVPADIEFVQWETSGRPLDDITHVLWHRVPAETDLTGAPGPDETLTIFEDAGVRLARIR